MSSGFRDSIFHSELRTNNSELFNWVREFPFLVWPREELIRKAPEADGHFPGKLILFPFLPRGVL